MNLTTDVDLAAEWNLDLPRFHKLRRQHGWPCVRLSRFDIRFTPEQIDQIVRMQTVAPAQPTAAPMPVLSGQTKRSAARGRAS